METLSEPVEDLEWIAVEDDSAPGRVRRSALALAQRLGFTDHRAGGIGIAATELATNLHRHAVAGTVLLRVRRQADDSAIELVVTDAGPGMRDIAESARDGHSTAGTLGIGLGAARRLASWFDSHSVIGRGTVIVATFWRHAPRVERSNTAALTRPMGGEVVCGDACALREHGGTLTLLLADGLGHGELAAIAARTAVRAFASAPDGERPAASLTRVHTALRGTRGAAVGVARLDPGAGVAVFAGVGNVAGWVDDGQTRRALVSQPGIAGSNARSIREYEIALPKNALVVLHSDGLTSKWDLSAYPGLRAHDPTLVAATLIRDAGVHHDDASVMVARAS